MRRSQLLLAALLQLVLPLVFVRAQEIPQGVSYTKTTPAVNAEAEALVRKTFSSKPRKIAEVLGATSSQPIIVGPFLSGALLKQKLVDQTKFVTVENRIPLSKEVTPVMPGIGAKNPQQRELLDHALERWLPKTSAIKIRKLTPQELALIWYFIAWDITEPIFAVEYGGRILVVDFQNDGKSLFWLEDITEPCFRVSWEGGGLPDCYCSTVVTNGKQYNVGFTSRKDAATCGQAYAPQNPGPSTYQNPVDGKSYTADWNTYQPETKLPKDPNARVSLANVRLLTTEDIIARNSSADEISNFIGRTQANIEATIMNVAEGGELLVQTTISPAAAPKFQLSKRGDFKDADLNLILDNLGKLTDWHSKTDEVAYQIHLVIKAKPKQSY